MQDGGGRCSPSPAGSSPPSPSDSSRRLRRRSAATTSRLRVSLFGDFGYHDLYKQYEAAHPGVTIKEEIQSYADHHTQLAQHLATGAGAADVEAIEVGFIPLFTAAAAEPRRPAQVRCRRDQEPLAALEVPAGGRQGRGRGRPRHGRRQPRDLLPQGPVREGGPPDQPRGRLEAVADVAGLHQHRQALPGQGPEGHVLLRHGLERLQRDGRPAQPGLLQRRRRGHRGDEPEASRLRTTWPCRAW